MNFKLDNNASNWTGNISGILSAEDYNYIRTLSFPAVELAFGPGCELCYDPDKGYEDPEWYWRADSGAVVGVGWRWGMGRLRGTDPTPEVAAEFVKFLRKKIQ